MVSSHDVSKALDARGLSHDHIFARGSYRNLAFSDDSTVFCKVLRPTSSARLAKTELALAMEYGSELMLTPLADDLVPVGDSLMSVWKWERMETFASERISADDSRMAAKALARIHASHLPKTHLGRIIDFDKFVYNIERRIAFGKDNDASSTHMDTLAALSDRYIAPQTFNSEAQPVLIHGDTHIGNVVRVQGAEEMKWIDFEGAKVAPRELDIATLMIDLLHVGGNAAAWTSARDVLYTDDVSSELVDQFSTIRMISLASSSLMVAGEGELFAARIDSLEPLLNNPSAVIRFPRKKS